MTPSYYKKIAVSSCVIFLIAISWSAYYLMITRRMAIKPEWNTKIYEKQIYKNGVTEVGFNILKSDSGTKKYGGTDFKNYLAGEQDSGWDFSFIFRYKNDKNYYRLMLSAERDEIALWKPEGGFLAVENVPLTQGIWHTISLQIKESTLMASIDGKTVLIYTDKKPILEGLLGIARYGNAVVLSKKPLFQKSSEQINQSAAPRIHTPNFYLKDWRGQKWVFNGSEPIAMIDLKQLIIYEAKLKKGYKPVGLWELFWKQHGGPGENYFADRLVKINEINGKNDVFSLEFESATPDNAVKEKYKMQITYDYNNNSYIYIARILF